MTMQLESAVTAYLQGLTFELPLDDLIADCNWQETQHSVEKSIENWKRLLALGLLNHFHGGSSQALSAKIYQFERHSWNQKSQYFRTLLVLNHLLAGLPLLEVTPHLLKGGAALFELEEFRPWLSAPSMPHHIEYGIWLCTLALMTQRQDLRETALQLVRWHINTLDYHYKPFLGLFVQEEAFDTNQSLLLYYLLFKGATLLCDDPEIHAVTAKLYVFQSNSSNTDLLWVLFERLFEKGKAVPSLDISHITPSQSIYDPSTALIGYRSPRGHAVCSLHGNRTGLGTLRFDDVEFVNYGPQYLPLGECQGFGILGNSLSDQGERTPLMQVYPQGFTMKGCVRLIDQPCTFQDINEREYTGVWLELEQEFKFPVLDLQVRLLSLDGWEGIALSFFVKARCCRIGATQLVPRSFDKYQGKVENLIFEGDKGSCLLKAPHSKAELQVIPLAGNQSFWGADFLIAYTLHSDQRCYQWQIAKQS